MQKKGTATSAPRVVIPRRQKFVGEHIEGAKLRLREAEVYVIADNCTVCQLERREFDDDTALCEIHLRQILGTSN